MGWVFIESEAPEPVRLIKGVWTVGFYKPSGEWEPQSDHASPEDAAAMVHYLNGGSAHIPRRETS